MAAELAAQRRVDTYFDAQAGFWEAVYGEPGLAGVVYRERMAVALQWVEALSLPAGSPALDAGCGAGLLAEALARRGLRVTASDASPAMVRRAQARAGPFTITQADVHRLPFAAGAFALVVALGVLPWLHDPPRAVRELARVLAPGGWLILSADNAAALRALTEPRENPLLAALGPPYRVAKRLAGRAGGDGAVSRRHLPGSVERMLRAAGLEPARRTTVGFGPFTLLGRPLLRDDQAIALHHRLQRLAGEHPALRRHGWHYLVAARKP